MEPGQRITVYVEYERRGLRIGRSFRLKTEFYNLQEFIKEIRLSFGVVIPYNVPLLLWRKNPDSTRFGLTEDRDLIDTIKRTRQQELILYAEKKEDAEELKRRVEVLEWEGQMYRHEIEKLKDTVAELRLQLEMVNRERGAIEGTPPAAGNSGFVGTVIPVVISAFFYTGLKKIKRSFTCADRLLCLLPRLCLYGFYNIIFDNVTIKSETLELLD